MYTLYFENIKIINNINPKKNSDKESLLNILAQIKYRNLSKNVELYWQNEEDFFNTIEQHTQLIEAAGGIVCNHSKEVLFIYRNSRWDLPKGKREQGEELVENAKREIEEETNVKNLVYQKNLDITYHLYYIENTCILKKTYWYVFQSSHQDILKPQIEEGIEEVKWVAFEKLSLYKDKMFLLIRELVEKYLNHNS